jgi:hypothetical protein
MTDEYEPRRLFETQEAPSDLRRLLARAHDDVPSLMVREHLVRAVTGRAIGSGAGGHGGAATLRWAARIAQHPIKFLTAAAALGVGAGALYISSTQQIRTPRAPRAQSAETRQVQPEIAPMPAAPEPAAIDAPAPHLAGASAPRVAPATRPPAPSHAHRATSIWSETGKTRGHLGARIAAKSASRRVAVMSPGEAPPVPQVTAPTADTRPAEGRSAEAKPAEGKAAEARPAEPRPVEAKPLEAKPEPIKAAEPEALAQQNRPAPEQPRVEVLGTEEARLLRSARRALAASPQRTLSLTDEHLRRYPHGILDQEREALAIEALMKLGRVDDARARARAFEVTYPDSPHRARIERALNRVPGAIDGP